MGKNARVRGPCRICGVEGELSFEHVPPKKAYNDRPVLGFSGRVLFEHGLDPDRKFGTHYHRGAGEHTLCDRCNNNTGAWYGPHYIEWCHAGMEVLRRSQLRPRAVVLMGLEPLAIIKQVVTMFFSANGERFREVHPHLVKLVLDRSTMNLPTDVRIYGYYNMSPVTRRIGVSGAINLAAAETRVMSEVSHPPYGYLMMFGSSLPRPDLFDISYFAGFQPGERADVYTQLPLLETHLPLPGDFRTRAEIERDAMLNDQVDA